MSTAFTAALGAELLVVVFIIVVAAILADAGTIAHVVSTWVGE